MKLRSITLTNVRRFTGAPVTLDGLGDGLNVVAAPNEAGKSTFFEALEALLFTPHRSGAAEARSLCPYASGGPEVAAEVELARGGFDEALDRLSGGTREQIAILTRLAFARLLARNNRATPVILDDALVYADDGRLARMLHAFATTAEAVQIVVLTCRRSKFAGLSAVYPSIERRDERAVMIVEEAIDRAPTG